MPAIGSVVSHYTILERIGAGGMGEVYRAEDRTLKRQVAIKVLPDHFTRDLERLARFEREAHVLASLNHPNIAAVYGFEEAGNQRFLVLELVEGQTLAERIRRGPLPVGEALEVCRQIAEGLESAHEKGIIHRDLKPANIKITPEGRVKVLDFGMAKALAEKEASPEVSQGPTITDAMTRPGTVLGTAAYMSPEQACGKPVDKRADIWAFGCVLFECLAGARAFQGATITETIAKVLESTPDWTTLPANTPLPIRALLRACLQKDPNRRLHDIADARIGIADALSAPEGRDAAASETAPWRGWILLLPAAGLAIGALAGTFVGRGPAGVSPSPVVRASMSLPPGLQLTREGQGPIRTEVALSPDGGELVLSASPDGSAQKAMLYRRPLDRPDATPIPGTEGARSPFFSPDGQWIGFRAQGKFFKVAAKGGVPDLFCEAVVNTIGASWGPDGRIVFGGGEGLLRVSEGSREPELLTRVDLDQEATHRLPQVLPGAKAVVFTVMPHLAGVSARTELLSLESGQRKVLIEDAADARYLPTGHLVFVRRGALMAVPFDLDRLETTGPAVTVVPGLMQALNQGMYQWNSGAGQYSVSGTGTLAYASGGISPDTENEYSWVDRRGRAEPWTAFGKRPAGGMRLSPDGQKVAYCPYGLNRNLWMHDVQRGTTTKLTSEGSCEYAVWTPDGRRVAFAWSKSGPHNIWWIPWDGSGAMERLTESDSSQFPGSWTRDGRYLALVGGSPSTGNDILVLRMIDRRLAPFASTRANERYPEFSPDGRWLAFSSDESGLDEIYLRSFPDGDRKIAISNDGGTEPAWAPDGRALFYWGLHSSRLALMKVELSPGPDPSAGVPKVLFEYPHAGESPIRGYDITPDGRRFLIPQVADQPPVEVVQLNLVINWFEELKRLSPTGR